MKYEIATETDLNKIAKLCRAAEKRKELKIFLKDKSTIAGFFYGYTKAIDNEPEIASIAIEDETGQLHGYGQDEIENIEVME